MLRARAAARRRRPRARRLRRRRERRGARPPAPTRSFPGAPRPAHRAPEPVLLEDRIQQALRPGSQRSGEPFSAHLRRPRRLQGRERLPRPRCRRRRAALARAAASGDRPRERHRRARRRRRVRDPLPRRPATTSRRPRSWAGSGMRFAARSASRARPSRSTEASAGPVFPRDGATADELIARADGQMYATKRDTPEDSLLARRGVDAGVIRDVEAALARDELVVVYQPILDLQSASRCRPKPSSAAFSRTARSCRPAGASSRTWSAPRSYASSRSSSSRTRSVHRAVGRDRSDSAYPSTSYKLVDNPQFVEGLADPGGRERTGRAS